jgi:predicted glycogen debranching enzyme
MPEHQPRLVVDEKICSDLSLSGNREWLETNGVGGYAASTITGQNTRRYHGLLVAATKPPLGRMVLLSKLEETLVIDGRRYELSTNGYPGVVHPAGYRHLKAFRLDPFPTFVFEVEGVEIEKRVFLVHGQQTVVIDHEFRGLDRTDASDCRWELRPLVAFRDYHATTHCNDALDPSIRIDAGIVSFTPYQGLPTLHLAHDATAVQKTGDWYFNFEYARELERGFQDREDLFNPFLLSYDLQRRTAISIVASTEPHHLSEVDGLREAEVNRRASLIASSPGAGRLVTTLVAAADQFIVRRGESHTVIAGYHWFGDWGRDTMIALPGLTLATGRTAIARGLLMTFARHVDQGMLPNRFSDAGEAPEYNTVDASLWMFEAVRAYLAQTNDWDVVRDSLFGVLAGIIEWYRRGTRFGIKVDDDGLLYAGEPGVQLTWMDARIGEYVVTPRQGKPVEVQALWYNALRVMESLADRCGDPGGSAAYAASAAHACASFNDVFWNESTGCLYDVVDRDRRDGSVRPNQIVAVSLPHSMLDLPRAKAVVAVVERELLTPRGLRTLAATDPRYQGRSVGGPVSRDRAYHQGTVWPWLIGPFVTAWMKVKPGRDSRATVTSWLAAFEGHLGEAGLGQISEIFDGDEPHEARGCVAQAWSVAELLRVAVDLAGVDAAVPASRPKRASPAVRPTGRARSRAKSPGQRDQGRRHQES